MNKPTYDEFYEAVRISFKEHWLTLSQKEADLYVKSESEYIKERYNEYSDRFDKKDISRKTFMVGGVGSTAYCLSMMY